MKNIGYINGPYGFVIFDGIMVIKTKRRAMQGNKIQGKTASHERDKYPHVKETVGLIFHGESMAYLRIHSNMHYRFEMKLTLIKNKNGRHE